MPFSPRNRTPLLPCLAVAVGITAWGSPVRSQAEVPAPSITQIVAGDPRLEKKVTLFAPRAYIGEVLEKWGKESGITLTADEQDGAADQTVCVLIKDVPLKDAMQALYSLLSYRGAEWVWERQGEKGAYQYTLHQSKAARDLPARVSKAMQDDYENVAAKLIQAVHASLEESKAIQASDPVVGTLLGKDYRLTRQGVLAFADSLSAEQQTQTLRSSQALTLGMGNVSTDGQKLADTYLQGKRRLNPTLVVPDATQVQFQTVRTGLTPSLFIGVGSGDGGFEGYEYIGGQPLESKWANQINVQWLLPDDQATTAAEKETIKAPSATGKSAVAGPSAILQAKETRQAARLWQLAEAANIPLMARLPKRVPMHTNPTDPGEPYGAVLEKYLQEASDRYLQHKWRSGVLLVASHQRLVDGTDQKTEPWALVRQAHTFVEASPDGTLTIPQLASLARQFNQQQLISVNETSNSQIGPAVGSLYGFFRLLGEKPGLTAPLLSASGSTNPEVMRVLGSLFRIDEPAPPEKRIVALRVTEDTGTVPGHAEGRRYTIPVRRFHFQALAGNGTVVTDVPLDQKRHLPSPNP